MKTVWGFREGDKLQSRFQRTFFSVEFKLLQCFNKYSVGVVLNRVQEKLMIRIARDPISTAQLN